LLASLQVHFPLHSLHNVGTQHASIAFSIVTNREHLFGKRVRHFAAALGVVYVKPTQAMEPPCLQTIAGQMILFTTEGRHELLPSSNSNHAPYPNNLLNHDKVHGSVVNVGQLASKVSSARYVVLKSTNQVE
jgi:hypothetical protein